MKPYAPNESPEAARKGRSQAQTSNIIISELITVLTKVPNLEIVTFADDILLMARGPSHSAVLKTVTDTLRTLENWCKSHKLVNSKDKTTLMPMSRRNSDNYKNHTDIKSWGLKVATKMKYLGIMLDSKMDWFPHTQYLENKLLHIRNNLARCSKATWDVSYANLVIIYKHAILPTITYTAVEWYSTTSKRAKNKLQQIQRSFLIFLTKAYRTVSLESFSAIAEIIPIDLTLKLFTDKRSITRGLPTNAVIVQLKKIETHQNERRPPNR